MIGSFVLVGQVIRNMLALDVGKDLKKYGGRKVQKDIMKIKRNKKKTKLNLKQERFCILYASDREFFGNGVRSYLEAYELNPNKKSNYNTAKSNAHVLLTNTDILDRINELLEEEGLNDAFVDKQLKFAITQCAEIGSKIRAINEYNKLRGRHAAQKFQLIDEYEDITPEEIEEELERRKLRGTGKEPGNKGESKSS